jgi:NAD(P)-dependent dehydrogenase (short-subunit alcohol dehydrogenase family)
MKTIVITGSTRGLGYGLAESFLARGCQVVISGRSQEAVEQSAAVLAKKHSDGSAFGHPCDVTDYAQVENLWSAAAARFGHVDIWINNAGIATTLTPFWELAPQQLRQVVNTNMTGTLNGCSVAVREMLKQGFGSVYIMEGFGSRGGRKLPGLTLYGASKAALGFLSDSLAKELEGKPVLVGSLSPGMVVTDMLLNQRSGRPADWERSKRAFNILADRVETVSPWLVEQILTNQKNGRRIAWLTGSKIMLRFLTAPFTRRNVIDD